MKIFIWKQQRDGTFVRHFYAISELESILEHKRKAKGTQQFYCKNHCISENCLCGQSNQIKEIH